MENQPQMSANDMLNKMSMIKFTAVFKAALDLVFKNPLMLFLVFAIPLLINGILRQFVYPAISGALLGGGAIILLLLALVFLLLSVAISFFGLGALVRATQMVNEGKPVNLGSIFSYVQKNFVQGVMLAIRLFIYTGAWIPLLYLAVTFILMTLGLYSGRAGVALIGLGGLLTFLFIFVLIAYIILFFKKIINSSLAYIYFFTSENPQVEPSLQSSLHVSENLTWTIFGNYFLMGLVTWLASVVLGIIFIPIFIAIGLASVGSPIGEMNYAGGESIALVSALIGSLVGIFSFAFQYKLKEQLEAFRAGKAPEMPKAEHHTAPAAHHEAHPHHEGHEHHEAHPHEHHEGHTHESHEGHEHSEDKAE